MYVYTQERIYVKLYRRMYVYTYVCIYVYMYIHNAAFMYICIYVFTQDKYGMVICIYVYMGSALRITKGDGCQAIHAGKRFQKMCERKCPV